MPASVSHQRHPALAWAWAGGSLVLLLTGQSDHQAATAIAIIFASLIIVATSKIPSHRIQTFKLGIFLALSALSIRMVMAVVIGVPMPGTTLFSLPQIALPNFLVGIRIGGPVTSERLLSALVESLVFAAIVIALATANSLTTPHQLLRVLPQRFYGFGLATSIASSVAPQTASSVLRVNQALHIRGDQSRGARRARRVLIPVLEESLERSIDLAAALEVRGYGISQRVSRYRPQKWGIAETLSILGIALLIAALPVLSLNLYLQTALITLVLLVMRILD
jgi:energy-coupling factor transporter transmembrane protein EcfT